MVVSDPVRCYVFETRGGALLSEVFPSGVSWSAGVNEAEQVRLDVDLNSVQDVVRVQQSEWVETRRNLIERPVPVEDGDWQAGSVLDASFTRRVGGVSARRTLTSDSSNLAQPLFAPVLALTSAFPIVPGLPYTISFYASASIAGFRSQVQVYWLRSSGVIMGSAVGDVVTGGVVGEWQRPSATLIPPEGAAKAWPLGLITTDGSIAPAGTQAWAMDALMEQSDTVGEFFPPDLVTATERTVWADVPNESALILETGSTMFSERTFTTDWRNLVTPWKHSIAVDIAGRLYGGPIMPHDFDDDGAQLSVTVRGIRVALDRRSVLPIEALTQSLVLPDGEPDITLDTNLVGFDLGTIGKKLVEQACEWPGWTDVPFVFPADRQGVRERNYPAVERKSLDDALSDLSGVENGPDFRFQLEWDGSDAFRWVFSSGTEAQPRLQAPDVFAWEVGQGSGLAVQSNPSSMGSLSWSQGGRADDTTIIRSLYDPTLIDHGFLLLELESDASSNTVEESTLDAWNAETLRTAMKPWEFWSFTIRADQSPYPSEYNVGDLIDVHITESSPISGGFIEPGVYRRRIAALSGDMSEWIEVTCGESY